MLDTETTLKTNVTETANADSNTPLERRTTLRKRILARFDLQLLLLGTAILALMIFFSLQSPVFLTQGNMLNVLNQNSMTFVVAAGAGMLLIAGYIDMSVGSVMALAGVCAALTFVKFGLVPGILVALAVGIGVGIGNGLLIGVVGLSPIVVTLGGLASARGLAQVISPGSLYGMPPEVTVLGTGRFLGLTYLIWIAIIVCVATYIISSKMPIGRHIMAIGANPRAAFLSGIAVKRNVFLLYVGVGAAVGLAAVMSVGRLGSAPSGTLGLGFETAILTAILLGGIPFTGGRGSVVGVIMGVWLIAILNNGLTLMNVPPETSGIITGLVLVLAAASSLRGFQAKRRHPRKKLTTSSQT